MRSRAKKGGWHWTKRGWQRNKPQRRASTTTKPAKKHKTRKPVVVVAPPEREQPAYDWRTPQIAQEGLLRRFVPTPARVSQIDATRPPRAAWHGKYDQLQPPTPEGS